MGRPSRLPGVCRYAAPSERLVCSACDPDRRSDRCTSEPSDAGAFADASCDGPTRGVEFPVPLAPIAEQHRIVAKVDELMGVCAELERSLTAEQSDKARLLVSLLHDALSLRDLEPF